MTIQNIKDKFGFITLSMIRQFSKEGAKQKWLSHWDNERRIRICMHENVCEFIKANLQTENLEYYVQEVKVTLERKAYTRIVIIIRHKTQNQQFEMHNDYDYSYEKYNNAYGYDDDTIDNAFEGDPSNYWNID